MGATLQRLKEVMYMYNQMIKSPKEKPTLFIANLNSFITLARSVTNVMQKEFHGISRFAKWYIIKQKEMRNDKDMKFFIELRNESLKEHSVGRIVYIITLLQNITLKSHEILTWPSFKHNTDGDLVLDENNKYYKINNIPKPEIKYNYSLNYLFIQKPEIPAKILCFNHYKKLEKLVIECDEKFSDLKKTYKTN